MQPGGKNFSGCLTQAQGRPHRKRHLRLPQQVIPRDYLAGGRKGSSSPSDSSADGRLPQLSQWEVTAPGTLPPVASVYNGPSGARSASLSFVALFLWLSLSAVSLIPVICGSWINPSGYLLKLNIIRKSSSLSRQVELLPYHFLLTGSLSKGRSFCHVHIAAVWSLPPPYSSAFLVI